MSSSVAMKCVLAGLLVLAIVLGAVLGPMNKCDKTNIPIEATVNVGCPTPTPSPTTLPRLQWILGNVTITDMHYCLPACPHPPMTNASWGLTPNVVMCTFCDDGHSFAATNWAVVRLYKHYKRIVLEPSGDGCLWTIVATE